MRSLFFITYNEILLIFFLIEYQRNAPNGMTPLANTVEYLEYFLYESYKRYHIWDMISFDVIHTKIL